MNNLIFNTKISNLNKSAEDITSLLENSNATSLNSTEQSVIESITEGLSVGYPESLGKLAYPLSRDKKNTVSQIYKLADSNKLYVDTLSRLSEISTVVSNVPQKDKLAENPTLFINSYNNSIDELKRYEQALDVDVLLKIFIAIRDSAELYVNNDRFDLFEARYDNVYSELDKEYQKSIEGLMDDVINELNSLQRSIEKL